LANPHRAEAIAGTLLALPAFILMWLMLLGPALLGSALGADAWKGVALGTTTAVVYSVYVIAGSRVGKHTTPMMSSAIIVTSAAACFAGVTLVRGDALPHSTSSWLGAMALALVATVLAITAILAGLARVGSVRGSTLAVLEPAVTVLVGVVILHEPFSPWQYLGGACVLAAAIVGARSSKAD
jgi:drug/metabolite transporter (DMT)-like permease